MLQNQNIMFQLKNKMQIKIKLTILVWLGKEK
jgi:hypothetical protein